MRDSDFSPDAFTEVFTTLNGSELALLKSVFDSEDIPYHAQGEEFSVIRGGGALPVRILVPREHAERARDLVRQMMSENER